MKAIFVPVAVQPFADFTMGAKTWEVRNANSPVAKQVRKAKPGAPVRLRWGYGPHGKLGIRETFGELGRTWEGPADEMPDEVKRGACLTQKSWTSGYFDPGGQVLCFEVLGLAVLDASDMKADAQGA